MKQAKLPPIQLSEEGPFFIVTLPRGELATIALNKRQNAILSPQSGSMVPFSTMEYASKFGISERAARMDINDLVNKGMLVPTREGRKIKYIKK